MNSWPASLESWGLHCSWNLRSKTTPLALANLRPPPLAVGFATPPSRD